MARGKPLGYVCYVIMEDGSTKELHSLTGEEMERLRKNTMERLSKTMTEYYMQHPEELAAL